MNPANYQPPYHWAPMLPPDPPRCGVFWNTKNVSDQLKQLQDTLHLAKSMEDELDALRMIKDGKGSMESVEEEGSGGAECLRIYVETVKIDMEEQEKLSVEAANSLMYTLRAQLEPFRFVVDENSPWEERSAAARLACRMKKSKRNKLWKKNKRRCVAEMRAKEPERFEKADREADEWREKEMAKDMANRKVDEMKAIEKVKAKRERRRLEPELELALIVEEMQELRSLRIDKLKKQGHFLPEEDDKFFESVRAAVEQEENQAQSVTNTETQENVIASEEHTSLTTDNKIVNKDTDKESNTIAEASCEKTTEAPLDSGCDNVSNLPVECYHYYYGSNLDMGRLIEIRREWDAYLSPGGSRIPGHWVQPSPPVNEIWASCLVKNSKERS
ncbi:U11/U12 small nuclear ribonucleoprotein 59 kDa protein [Raphanus sativus]|uniref:U11/U12 small nuclear ribonucleoprotein 59 kDa protein n=1 Tax=Raphanus sativus TaxID=3726 RepID=A0A6J0JLW0_RAPSA|nr:U11/U12 small nuclear ribonucleoprotein 59 kDa protein [Raphanus sativus]KAJ4892418.1 U11/U12 small nuclear ribonucleoprotein 59 kDa protein [Raphanus sativus]